MNRGVSLVEVLLASALFSLMLAGFAGVYLYGVEATALSGNRAQAAFLAEEGFEIVRNIGEADFENLLEGTHGLGVSGSVWGFVGVSDTNGIFTRSVQISSVDADRKNVVVEVSWDQNLQRSGVVTIESQLTNWRATSGTALCTNQADYLDIDTSNASLGQGNRTLQNIELLNTNTTCDIVIDTIEVTWINLEREIRRINIGSGSPVWSGSASSGTELDITDTTLSNSDGQVESTYRFNGRMTSNTFVLQFTLSDGTTKSVIDVAP